MTGPLVVAVGHTTSTSTRILALFEADATEAALVLAPSAGPTLTLTLPVDAALPFGRALFEVSWPDPSTSFRYVVVDGVPVDAQAALRAPDAREVTVPSTTRPPRVAAVSCNHVLDQEGIPAHRADVLWRDLADRVHAGEVDLVVHGGDQIYADRAPPGFVPGEPWDAYYRRHYVATWSVPAVAEVLRSVPNVFVWDDHEIRDGHGSQDDDRTAANQDRFASAKRIYEEMQVALNPPSIDPGSSAWAFSLGDTVFVATDGRAHRSWSDGRVLGQDQLARLGAYLSTLDGATVRQVYVVAAVPLLFLPAVASSLALPLARLFVPAEVDDIRDAWDAPNNRGECTQLLRLLFELQARTGVGIALLSGDIHVGTYGRIRWKDRPGLIHQVTASGIANPPPVKLANLLSDKLGWVVDVGSREFPGTLLKVDGHWLVNARNYAICRLEGGELDFVQVVDDGTGVTLRRRA